MSELLDGATDRGKMQGIQARLSSTEDLDASRGLKSVLNVIIYNM